MKNCTSTDCLSQAVKITKKLYDPFCYSGVTCPVWKISSSYARCPLMLMRWTQRIGTPSSHRTAPNLEHEKLHQIYCLPYRNILLTFFYLLQKIHWPFCNLRKIFVGWFFFSPVTWTKIPLCAENSMTLMRQVWRKPYYIGHTPKFLAQSHHFTRHIWHNVFPVWSLVYKWNASCSRAWSVQPSSSLHSFFFLHSEEIFCHFRS